MAYDALLKDFSRNEPATEDQIVAFERAHGSALPACYRDFLKAGNGGEGSVGEYGYAGFWKVEEVAVLNRDYGVQEYLSGYLAIGSDMGGEMFAIKYDAESVRYVQVPFVGLCEADCTFMGHTFGEFLTYLGKDH